MDEKVSYPKMVYARRDGEIVNCTVQNPRELAALGSGWAESPSGPFSSAPPKRVKVKAKAKR